MEIIDSIPESWKHILYNSKTKPILDKILIKLEEEINIYKDDVGIYPKQSNIFNAFKFCSPDKIKCCIFGQDPYHQFDTKTRQPQAHGLAFSVQPHAKFPPSLRNILKSLIISSVIMIGFLISLIGT